MYYFYITNSSYTRSEMREFVSRKTRHATKNLYKKGNQFLKNTLKKTSATAERWEMM